MIQFVKNKNIDRSKWDKTVLQYSNGRMNMLSSYLDAVCTNWDALIFDDYEAIMALPNKRNWALQRIHYTPLFVQQLGIIGGGVINESRISSFVTHAQTTHKKFVHQFNHENGSLNIQGSKSTSRTNYELDLNSSFSEIQSKYKDNLKRKLKESEDIVIGKTNDIELLSSFIVNYSNTNDPSPSKLNIIKQINKIQSNEVTSDIYTATSNDEIIAVCLAPRFKNRVTLLIPRSNQNGRDKNAMAVLIDHIIKCHAGSDMVLDFEGSMLPGVAQFYQSFGAIDREYTLLTT